MTAKKIRIGAVLKFFSNAQYFGSLLHETNITGTMKRPPHDYDLVIDYCSCMVAIATVRHIVDSSNLDVQFQQKISLQSLIYSLTAIIPTKYLFLSIEL